MTRRKGTSPTQASGQRSKFGKEKISNAAETRTIPESVIEGASARTRAATVVTLDVPEPTRGGGEITCCIDQEFTKPRSGAKVSVGCGEVVLKTGNDKPCRRFAVWLCDRVSKGDKLSRKIFFSRAGSG